MFSEELKLVEPSDLWCDAYIDFINEFDTAGESWGGEECDHIQGDFYGFVKRLYNNSKGIGLAEGLVAATTYWLVKDKKILGVGNIRHRLTDALRDFGGHIGYRVRPLERNKGYGTMMLKLLLQEANKYGIHRVLVTFNVDNIASIRVIQKNGGRLDSESYSHRAGRILRRYWIDTTN